MPAYIRCFFFWLFLTFSNGLLAQVENESSDTLSRVPVHLRDSVPLPSMQPDTLRADTLVRTRETGGLTFRDANAIDQIIDSDAKDSIITDMRLEKTFLYNEAVVVYGDIRLVAGYMEIDMKNKEVLATGVLDSLGNIVQKPVFSEGGKEYRTDTIRYNFDTGKAIIKMLLSQEGEGFMQGRRAKKMDDDILYIQGASYTTCSHETPHFRIMTTRTKILPNDRIVTGPAYVEVLELPTPLLVPFGFFPTMDEKKSGILIPAYGSSLDRGHFLRNGGFYLSISDYWDYTLRTDIFSRGGYGLFNQVNYAQRYRYRGSFNIDYNKIVIGRPEFVPFGNYQNSNDFSIRWNHQQDPKANPNLMFSANVNIATQRFNQLATQNPNDFLANQLNSSINLTRNFPNRPFTVSLQAGHDQSNATGNLNLDLPTLNVNMNRIMPFKKSTFTGKVAWYEKITLNYTGNFRNRIETTLDDFDLNPDFLAQNARSGVRHVVPIEANYRIFKYFTLSPGVTYNNRWNFHRNSYSWNDSPGVMAVDTVREEGFFMAQNFDMRANLTTKIYGQFRYKKGPVQAVRHVITPTVGFSYNPDFSDPLWGMYQEVQINPEGDTRLFDRFSTGLERSVGPGRRGAVTFRIDNILEGKLRGQNDTTDGVKIKFLEGLSINGSYNLAAEEFQWSTININARTSILKGLISFNYVTTYDPYGLDENGVRINEFQYNINGQILRPLTNNFNVSTSLSNRTFEFLQAGKSNPSKQPNMDPFDPLNVESGFGAYTTGDPNYFLLNYYVDYNATWNLRVNYIINTRFVGGEPNTNQTVDFSGDINLTKSWRIGFSSGYDIVNNGFSYTSMDFYRDLHCWELSCRWIPFGVQQSYFLTLGVRAPMFKDLKLERQRGIGDFGQRF
ncbi:MAG: LPS-assembly protein LptD [Flavobacteriales bacterium]|nr:MAG: LPS-assembly protein LptD [Flavobacteriales bacterium]